MLNFSFPVSRFFLHQTSITVGWGVKCHTVTIYVNVL